VNARTAAALASLAILMAGTTAPSALFVVYRDAWGLSTRDLGVVFAAYVCTLLPVLVLFGGIADRIGRRAAIGIGLALALVGLVTLALASGFAGLVVARLLQGAGVGLASGAIIAAVTESHRGRLAPGSWTMIASGTGIFTGPLVAAVAYDLGAREHAAYAPLVVLTVACAAALPLLAPRVVVRAGDAVEEPLPQDVVARALAFALSVTFVSWTGVSLYLSMVPAFLAATLHAHDPLVGATVISALQLAGILATLSRRTIVPERDGVIAPLVVVIGLIALVAGTALHGFAGWSLIVLSTVLVGAGGGVAFATAIVIATRVCRGQRARIFARLYVAAYLAFSVPSLVIGTIATRWSLATGFAVIIVVLAALVAMLPALRARARLSAVAP
jgi:MFS family permease